jgi:hypothetical protein
LTITATISMVITGGRTAQPAPIAVLLVLQFHVSLDEQVGRVSVLLEVLEVELEELMRGSNTTVGVVVAFTRTALEFPGWPVVDSPAPRHAGASSCTRMGDAVSVPAGHARLDYLAR